MRRKILYGISLFLLMLVTGVFWGTWFTLTRSIEQFSSEEFAHIGRVIIANVAMPMRIILPSCILSMLLSLWYYQNKRTPEFYIGVVSFILIVAVLLITLIVLVPIDNDIKEWTSSTLPDDWENVRSRWKMFHASRTFISLLSFASLSWACLSDFRQTRRNKLINSDR